tara:strand:- start:5939 stop:7066 length:1128 start_codon:yes stop_codon:yes gene_type:complete
MLDRSKLLGQLDKVSRDVFHHFAKEQDIAYSVFKSIQYDETLSLQINKKKYSLLLPEWKDSLNFSRDITQKIKEYAVLAVDGSQIYYDKHQGPGCYLINVGTVLLDYSLPISKVDVSSYPYVFVLTDQNREQGSTDFINLQREEYEFEYAWQLSNHWKSKNRDKTFLTMFDGSLIFFQLDSQGQEQKQAFLQSYLNYLHRFYEEKILIVGYMSFPRSRELVNILRLVLVQFDEQELEHHNVFNQLTDMDIVKFFLKPGQRSTIFKSKAPISYIYPQPLKPYFCYMHMGYEIVRLEFPAWIAQDINLVDKLCLLAYDQAQKGRGYPVCLFEAHEQAVVKGYDREFFYAMMQKKIQQQNFSLYQRSYKSLKKMNVPF